MPALSTIGIAKMILGGPLLLDHPACQNKLNNHSYSTLDEETGLSRICLTFLDRFLSVIGTIYVTTKCV